MVSKKERGRTQKSEQETNNDGVAGYEQFRDQRIKENMERMEKLGILELSRKLKTSKSLPPKNPPKKKPALPPSEPTRRSSRLTNRTPVNYSEKRTPKKEGEEEKLLKNLDIHIKEGSKPEIYTEEHENLLGDCKTTWTLYVDGYDEDGHRIYDPFEGKSCHQCRQKTLGLHTDCCNCRLVQGQLCGDCLYMRYGENVIEANKNPGWNCPVCRGICNCSRCRREKGWEPTGNIYRKVLGLGFRSVAHYLIQTHRVPSGKNPLSANRSLFADREAYSSDGIPKPESDGNKLEMEQENSKRDGGDGNVNYVDDSDDDYEEDDDNSEDADNGEHLSDRI